MNANAVLPEEKTATRVVTKPFMISNSISLTLSRRAFSGLWCVVFAVALSSGLFLLASAYVYLATDDGDGYSMLSWLSSVYLYHDAADFLGRNRIAIGVGYLLPALPFWLCCFYLAWHSFRSRRLSFGARVKAAQGNKSGADTVVRGKRWLRVPTPPLLIRMSERMQPFGIRGKYFKQGLLVIETFEITLQTIQAYRYSNSISNRFVNAWCGSIILVNCWSGPALHFITAHFHQNVLMDRLLCVLVDEMLDFLWGTTMQFFLAWPYISIFHAWTIDHDAVTSFDKTAETAERELMQIFVTSWPNYAFNIFPFVTSAIVLIGLCALLREAEQELRKKESRKSINAVNVRKFRASAVVVGSWGRRVQLLTKAYTVALMTYGVAVLGVSLTAARFLFPTEESLVFCQNRVYPWFTAKESCVGRQINCTVSGITGRRDEISAAMGAIDPSLVAKLEFCDCPELEIPTDITQFHAVGNLRFVNVTLRLWDADAAISNSAFPQLKTLQIKRSTIACIPFGIFHQPLPDAFEWISFHSVNADTFLHLVGDAWSNVIYFYCIECGLVHVPEMVKSMFRVDQVALDGNSLTAVSLDDLGGNNSRVSLLTLDSNPLTSLPEDVWALSCQTLWYNSLQFTNVTAVSEVVGSQCTPDLLLLMHGTPVCESPPEWLVPLVRCDEV